MQLRIDMFAFNLRLVLLKWNKTFQKTLESIRFILRGVHRILHYYFFHCWYFSSHTSTLERFLPSVMQGHLLLWATSCPLHQKKKKIMLPYPEVLCWFTCINLESIFYKLFSVSLLIGKDFMLGKRSLTQYIM